MMNLFQIPVIGFEFKELIVSSDIFLSRYWILYSNNRYDYGHEVADQMNVHKEAISLNVWILMVSCITSLMRVWLQGYKSIRRRWKLAEALMNMDKLLENVVVLCMIIEKTYVHFCVIYISVR